jgi:hypothetical protein
MVARLDFGLLRPLDLGGAVQAFDTARTRRVQQQQAQTEQGLMQQRLTMQQQELDREAQGNDAVASFFESMAGVTPEAPAIAPMANAAPAMAPMTAEPAVAAMTPAQAPMAADMAAPAEMAAVEEPMQTVTAKPNPMRFLADMARAGQGQMAMQLWEKSRTMQSDERKRIVESYDAIAAATQGLAPLPYEQRKAALVNMAPALLARGVPMQMIESFDPTDEALTAARNQALGINGVLQQEDRVADNQRAEREFSYRQSNDAQNRAVTLRGQNMTDLRARQKNTIDAGNLNAKLTEGQGKATGYLRLAQQAENTLAGAGAVVPGEFARGAYGVPFVERLVGGEDRKVLAAQEAFTEASLRFLTGAAVTKDEARRNVSQFFPAPGDTPEVAQQKADYRASVMAGMRDAAGPGAIRVDAARQAPQRQQPRASAGPAIGTVQGGYRFKGGDPARRTNWERVG